MPRFSIPVLCLLLIAHAALGQPVNEEQQSITPLSVEATATIQWDEWGVPHISAESLPGVFYGFGWAQMELHGNLILDLYGRARGRAAEYWGAQNVVNDRLVRVLGIPDRSERWFNAHDEEFQRCLDAFVRGMNDFAAAHPDRLDDALLRALPIRATDPLARTQTIIHGFFVGAESMNQALFWQPQGTQGATAVDGSDILRGSNAWAIAPRRSEDGHAMLLINPHLPWIGQFQFTEVHLTAPGLDVYGATLVGLPMILLGFNENLGWALTVNTFDGSDLYELQLTEDGAYLLDDEAVPLVIDEQTLRIRDAEGALQDETLTIEDTVFGPILQRRGDRALAVRIAGFDRPLILPQFIDMARATDRMEFETALSRLQMPMFNTIYADTHGEIAYYFNATMPKRKSGDWSFWGGVIPGETSDYLWTEYHDFSELPQFANPASGFIQNANEPPWTSTFPPVLSPDDYPPYFAGQGMDFRPQHSVRLLLGDDSISFDELLAYADDTAMDLALRILPELIAALETSDEASALRAGDVLRDWDGRAEADSRGAVLFHAWAQAMGQPPTWFADDWDPAQPLQTPNVLAQPDQAVALMAAVVDTMDAQQVPLDIPFGQSYRLRYAGRDLPASAGTGAYGAFRVGTYQPANDGRYVMNGGSTFVTVVEFGDRIQPRGYLVYGNSTQPDSEYIGDQIELFSRREWRDIYFYPGDVEAHAARTEQVPPAQ